MQLKPIGSNQTIITQKLPNGERIDVLYSYETPVALESGSGNWYKTKQKWSVTTSKHINKFLPEDRNRVIEVDQDDLNNWEILAWD